MRSQCPDCGEMVPEGHSERCGDPADASLDESIPTLNMMRSARRVIKFWEERIALKGGDVPEGYFQFTALVEPNLANAALAFADQAAMPAGVTENAVVFGAPERADDGALVHHVGLHLIGDSCFRLHG